jgi:hypothetical protein
MIARHAEQVSNPELDEAPEQKASTDILTLVSPVWAVPAYSDRGCGEPMSCGRLHHFVWRGKIIWAARSAMTIVGAFVLPLVIVGMIDASATRRLVVP